MMHRHDLKLIKFLLTGTFGKRNIEKIKDGCDLIQLLEERDWISPNCVDRLSEILRSVQRNDLDVRIQGYIGQTISQNISYHDIYGETEMHIHENYVDISEYERLWKHMEIHRIGILQGPPGSWKSLHAFRFAHQFSKDDHKSLKWKIDCKTDFSIYNSLSHLISFLKIQCVTSQKNIEESIRIMVKSVIKQLESDLYKSSKHLLIFLGSLSRNPHTIEQTLLVLKPCSNIQIIVTTIQSLSPDWDKYVLQMKGMTKDEAVNFITTSCEESTDDAKKLAKQFSYLPDGLLFARTYLRIAKISIKTYLKDLKRKPLAHKDESLHRACEMLLKLSEEKMTAEEKWLLHLLPYMNTHNIHVFILKELLLFYSSESGEDLSEQERNAILDNLLVKLSNYSLLSITGRDDNRTINAHAFTFMVLFSTKTKETKHSETGILLQFFTRYFDVDARLLEVINRNMLLLNHAELLLNICEDYFQTNCVETKAMQCYLLCAIGITYRFYGNTEITADKYFQDAKSEIYKVFLKQTQPLFESTELSTSTMLEYLRGSASIQTHAKEIFTKLLVAGASISKENITDFVKNKRRTTKEMNLLCQNGCVAMRHNKCNRVLELFDHLVDKSLILPAKYISETFLVELMIRILYNESKNLWLMDLSEEEFKNTSDLIRKHLTSSYFPVTANSLAVHQVAHHLTVLLHEYLSKIQPDTTSDKTHLQTNSENKICRYSTIFGPVTIRNGVLYMLRSTTSENLPNLLHESITILDKIDIDVQGVGFVEFGVVKRIGDSSLYHTMMIDRLKMECYEKLSNANIVLPKESRTCINVEENRLSALKIATSLENHVDEMKDWRAESEIRLKLAKVYYRLSRDEEGYKKAMHHIKKAYETEFTMNNSRLTRFHLKAIVHYGECCLKYPTEKELLSAKQLLDEMKCRFKLGQTDKLFDDVIKDLESALDTVHLEHDTEKRGSKVIQDRSSNTSLEIKSEDLGLTAVEHEKLRKLTPVEKETEEEFERAKEIGQEKAKEIQELVALEKQKEIELQKIREKINHLKRRQKVNGTLEDNDF